MKRLNFSSGAQWEKIVGYSRAVKIGNTIEIAGTVATDGEKVMHVGDSYLQAIFIIEKIKHTLEQLDSGLHEVVRTRIFVTNIRDWEKIGRAHGEYFQGINPVTTMVEVAGLIESEYLVEIEATAITGQENIEFREI